MRLHACKDAVERIARLAIWVLGAAAIAVAVADDGGIEPGSTRGSQVAEGQSDEEQLQYERARHGEADKRPSNQTPRSMLL
jgi:hypothetical protein